MSSFVKYQYKHTLRNNTNKNFTIQKKYKWKFYNTDMELNEYKYIELYNTNEMYKIQ